MALRTLRLRQFSNQSAKFPFCLPKDFSFIPSSIVYSNGKQLVPESSTGSVPVYNPATEELLQSIDCASPDTVKSTITDAQNVFTSGQWSRAEPTERFRVLNRIAEILRQQNKELAARKNTLEYANISSGDITDRSTNSRNDGTIRSSARMV